MNCFTKQKEIGDLDFVCKVDLHVPEKINSLIFHALWKSKELQKLDIKYVEMNINIKNSESETKTFFFVKCINHQYEGISYCDVVNDFNILNSYDLTKLSVLYKEHEITKRKFVDVVASHIDTIMKEVGNDYIRELKKFNVLIRLRG